MITLVRKLINLGLAASLNFSPLSIPTLCKAEEKPMNSYQLSLSIASHKSNDEVIDDIYGGGLMLKGGISTQTKENMRLEGSIGYMSRDGTPYILGEVSNAEAKLTLFEFDVVGHFLFNQTNLGTSEKTNIVPYVGAGFSYIKLSEKLSGSAYSETINASGSLDNFGYIIVGGVDIPIDNTKKFFLEASYNSASADNELWGKSTDLGGKSIRAGMRFNFQ